MRVFNKHPPVGFTPFYADDALRERLGSASRKGRGQRRGTPVVYVKDESRNPTGTHKDRTAVAEISRQIERSPFDVNFVCVTDGNMARSLAYFARFAPPGISIRVTSIVDRSTPNEVKKELMSYGSVLEADLGDKFLNFASLLRYIDDVGEARRTSLVPVGGISVKKWGGSIEIADELVDYEHVDDTYTIFLPIGGGNTAVGMVKSFEEHGVMPRIIAATVPGNLFSDIPYDGYGHETKLYARHSGLKRDFGFMAERYGIRVMTIEREKRKEMSEYLQGIGIRAGPSASVAFAAAERYAGEIGFDEDEPVVIVNTGCEKSAAALNNSGHLGAWKEFAATGLFGLAVLQKGSNVIQETKRKTDGMPSASEVWQAPQYRQLRGRYGNCDVLFRDVNSSGSLDGEDMVDVHCGGPFFETYSVNSLAPRNPSLLRYVRDLAKKASADTR